MNKKGILYGIGAYALWGFFPIYWKLLHQVPAVQLISHRIGWSFILLILVIFVTKQWTNFRSTINARTFRIYTIAALLIGVNWLVYVWAVNADYIVETSLGYFINPLLSMLMGVFFCASVCASRNGFLLVWPPLALAISLLPMAACRGLRSCWRSRLVFMVSSKKSLRLVRFMASHLKPEFYSYLRWLI